MNVEMVMTGNVSWCRPEDRINEAARIMWDRDCGSVPVVDDEGRVVGMITDRDICMAAYFEGRPIQDLEVRSVMARKVRFCKPGDSLATAAGMMGELRLRRLPVVDALGKLVGMLSLADVARAMTQTGGKSPGVDVSKVLAGIVGSGAGQVEKPSKPAKAARTARPAARTAGTGRSRGSRP